MISISSNLNLMIKAAEKASKSVIRDFGEVEKLQVSKKGPYDFVTKTDKNVEKILIEELSKSKKNYSFITEETGTINNKDKEMGKRKTQLQKRKLEKQRRELEKQKREFKEIKNHNELIRKARKANNQGKRLLRLPSRTRKNGKNSTLNNNN